MYLINDWHALARLLSFKNPTQMQRHNGRAIKILLVAAVMAIVSSVFMSATTYAVPPCYGGQSIWYDTDGDGLAERVGCKYRQWGPNEEMLCNGLQVIYPVRIIKNGTPVIRKPCWICIRQSLVSKILQGDITGFKIGTKLSTAQPMTSECLKCLGPVHYDPPPTEPDPTD